MESKNKSGPHIIINILIYITKLHTNLVFQIQVGKTMIQ